MGWLGDLPVDDSAGYQPCSDEYPSQLIDCANVAPETPNTSLGRLSHLTFTRLVPQIKAGRLHRHATRYFVLERSQLDSFQRREAGFDDYEPPSCL